MITESLSFSSSSFYRFATLFFICFFSSRALSFDRISDLLYIFFYSYKLKAPINRSALCKSNSIHPLLRFPFCHWCADLLAVPARWLLQPSASGARSKERRQNWRWNWNWLLYYALSTEGAYQAREEKKKQKQKFVLTLKKSFQLGDFFSFFSSSMQKQFETRTERNKKWFLK